MLVDRGKTAVRFGLDFWSRPMRPKPLSNVLKRAGVADDRICGVRLWSLAVLALFSLTFFPFALHAQTKPSSTSDADCLACHGQKDLKAASGRSVFVDEARHKKGVHFHPWLYGLPQ
jgi:hypothetical protein